MDTGKLLAEVKTEIARLQKVADLLEDSGSKRKGKRTLSKAARKKIAAAQRKRWAKVHRAAKGTKRAEKAKEAA